MARINAEPGRYRPWPGETYDGGVSNAILSLAETLAEAGAVEEAECWFREIAERGDARAAAALVAIHASRGESEAAAEWRRKAAELSDALLTRNKRALQIAYGESGVLRHVRIIQDYAGDLEAQGKTTTAEQWHFRASQHMPTDLRDTSGDS